MTKRNTEIYDCAIAGGGIAGLSLSILLARAGKKVILFEKEEYPFHKVSGGYFSNEGLEFLRTLGIDVNCKDRPQLQTLIMSSSRGFSIKAALDVGGIGISRYEVDNQLYHIAMESGVTMRTSTKVRLIERVDDLFHIKTDEEEIHSMVAVGAYGRTSNIDVELGRDYKAQNDKHLFIAVEHHIRIPFNTANVEIHGFPGGYCGISAYGSDLVNLSYISRGANLKKHSSIARLEKNVLSANPYLKKYFEEGEFLLKKPLTISHVYFKIKEPVTDHILMIGDAAGNIAPISGNGMSIATHSAQLASDAICPFLEGEISFSQMEQQYIAIYRKTFAERIWVSKQLTHLLVNPVLSNLAFPFFKAFPVLVNIVSRKIHGDAF